MDGKSGTANLAQIPAAIALLQVVCIRMFYVLSVCVYSICMQGRGGFFGLRAASHRPLDAVEQGCTTLCVAAHRVMGQALVGEYPTGQ